MSSLIRDDTPEGQGDEPCFSVHGNPYFGDFSITYDDRPIKNVRSLSITMAADALPEVTITLVPGTVDVELLGHLRGSLVVTTDQYKKITGEEPLWDDDGEPF